MTTRLYTHQAFENHRTPAGHPERIDRLEAVRNALADDRFDKLDRVDAPSGDLEHFAKVHPEYFVEAIINGCSEIEERGLSDPDIIASIDGDTSISPGSLAAMRHLIGAGTDAVDAVFEGGSNNCFVAARPPGHHAEKTTAMGFCLMNGIAAAARYAQHKFDAERVAIVDWDVHHGNGTQDIFWDDPSVMLLSTHQMPLFPGTGALTETGSKGTIINAPLSHGDGSRAFRDAFRSRILPELDNFRPDLILISAGFDAHHRDPLGGLLLDEGDFDWATGQIMERAEKYCSGRLVSILEGGYDLDGLSNSVATHVTRLMNG